jgi:hypothetical protein
MVAWHLSRWHGHIAYASRQAGIIEGIILLAPFSAAHGRVLYLGYRHTDRFAARHMMLAACLPRERVVSAAGGHDWDNWPLRDKLLGMLPFGEAASHDR